MKKDTSFFDRHAANWEATCYPPPVRKQLSELVENFAVQPKEFILDVGTGPGILLPYLRRLLGPEGKIAAFDLSFEMVRQALGKDTGNPHLIFRSDVHALPFGSAVFDRVICFAAFPHFHDGACALREMARVVRMGGMVYIAHLLSRAELARHHATQGEVAEDRLPDAKAMALLFQSAGLKLSPIIDQPGRYLAVGIKG